MVRRICLMYSSESADYEDLYQESPANIWRGFDSFRNQSGGSTWIYRICVNTCITWLRVNSRHRNMRNLEEALTQVAGDDSERREQLQMMYNVISTLDALQKSIIMMWLDGFQYDQIAEVTGLKPTNVAVRLHRIKEKIKKQIPV